MAGEAGKRAPVRKWIAVSAVVIVAGGVTVGRHFALSPEATGDPKTAQARRTLFSPPNPELDGLISIEEGHPHLKAIQALGRSRAPEAAAVLGEFLTTRDANCLLKQQALVALGRLGSKEAIEAIRRFESWAEDLWSKQPDFTFGKKSQPTDHIGSYTLAPLAATRADDKPGRWALFSWHRYGKWDYWLTQLRQPNVGSDPILIAIPGVDNIPRDADVALTIRDTTATVTINGRAAKLDLAQQRRDADGDGLADIVESRLQTDAAKADSDGDGLPDGRDHNPLTPKHQVVDDATEIRQPVFSALMATAYSQEAIVIVDAEGDFAGQEYYGYGGFILRSPEIREGFVNIVKLSVELQSPTTAFATIEDYEGPTCASGHAARLRKLWGKWVVTSFRLNWIS